ncbi:MAG: putative histidine kinase, hybrid [Polaromonas sp.]|nr:putative histidine kinase, hybrid [Polaromonas sp.]
MEFWPQPLKTAAGLMLRSRTPVMLAWGPALCLLYNDACLDLLGPKHMSALGQPLLEVWPEARHGLETCTATAGTGKCAFTGNGFFSAGPSGSAPDAHPGPSFSGVPVDAEDGQLAGIYFVLAEPPLPAPLDRGELAVQRNLASQIKAEADLRAILGKYHAVVNALPQIIWSAQPDGFHDYCNQQWHDFTGVPQGATDGDGWTNLFHSEDLKRVLEKWRHCLATGDAYEIEYRLRHCSGQYRWVRGAARPVRNGQGAIIRWIGTFTDIQAQKQAEENLQNSDRRKDEFLAMLAHELRNPLMPIATAADMLARGTLNNAAVMELSRVVERQARHMTQLIDDLLDVSRVTRGLVSLDNKPVDLKAVVADALEQIRPALKSKAHQLDVQLPPGSTRVMGDRLRLVQVLVSVLGNAIKYTPTAGRIALQMVAGEGHWTLRVRDNGIGMSAELVELAFELFTQGERSPDRSQGGLGIGLALVRSLVGLHGGSVRLQSAGAGLGSEVAIQLPRLMQHHEPACNEADDSPPARAPKLLRILVVDDNVDAARLLGMFLGLLGHEVFVRFHPADALECACKAVPDVCLLDIGLPDMDGYALARQLRSMPGMQHVAMAAVTGYSQPRDKKAAIAAGFDAHFAKPVDSHQLKTWLASVVGQDPPAIA